jgi:hypothetical protein
MVFFVLELGDYLGTYGVKHRLTHKHQYLNARKLWTRIATQLFHMSALCPCHTGIKPELKF